jgi:addiction module HigA family antidote
MKIDDRPFKNGMPPMHPGESLADDLNEMEISEIEMDDFLAVPRGTVAAIVEGRKDIDADFALRLSHFFGTTARFWMNLQNTYDLKIAEKKSGPHILKHVKQLPPVEFPVPLEENNSRST